MRRTNIYFSDDQFEKLTEMKSESDIKISEIVRSILTDHLDEYYIKYVKDKELLKKRGMLKDGDK